MTGMPLYLGYNSMNLSVTGCVPGTHISVQHASPFFGFGSYQNDEMAEKYRTIASKARGIDASVTNDVSPEGNINKQTMMQCKCRKRIKKTGSTVKTKRTNEPQ